MPRAGSTSRTSGVAIAQQLTGLNFPADKSALIEHARRPGPTTGRDPSHVVETLDLLPDRSYRDIEDVEQEVARVQEEAG